MSGAVNERMEALKLNLLILLGMQDAVSRDRAMRVGDIVDTASNPENTDGVRYPASEVHEALRELLDDEMVRHVKGEFDGSEVVAYATSFHPDHLMYITPMGILHVKRLIDGS